MLLKYFWTLWHEKDARSKLWNFSTERVTDQNYKNMIKTTLELIVVKKF